MRGLVHRGRWIAAPLLAVGLAVGVAGQAQAAPARAGLKATRLAPVQRLHGEKAPSSRLAQTDPALLNRTDATRIPVVVKLDYDSLATYAGGVHGLAATSPAATGHALNRIQPAERQYSAYIGQHEDTFVSQLRRRVPSATIGHRLRIVYGGVALTLPANEVGKVLEIPGVVAVQADAKRAPLTDASPRFIGATSVYPSLGGAANAGKGVILGVLDSGVWPEHPSFADSGTLPAPPPLPDGTPRGCDFGDNPLTPAADPFTCNHKLIGGRAFLQTYLSDPDRAAAEPYQTARDSNGHGTHTASTAGGDVVPSATLFGVERGPINGIAPGAWVSVYKICGVDGCFSSDSAAAVEQAVLDGVQAINYSISGGTDPYTDPVELAFLDAYAAGVFVAAAAGNDGPSAGTVNHLGPWVTTVAASTQERTFESTLTVVGADGNQATFSGSSITAGAGPAPIVLASAAPYGHELCDVPAPAGSLTGKIVVCKRGVNARVDKGYNVNQGGAAGMVLYNPTLADTETDNHWLPAVHLPVGTGLLAFLAANPGATASFPAGRKATGRGDVMAAFSSRGPAGPVLKPDVTAPGVQILAGNTPIPESTDAGPPGQYYQAIAGTSMSSPHVAGAGVLLRALHPKWTPGQIRSALMTTATTAVVKEDETTPADPFDMGAGRIALASAAAAGLAFDESAARMIALGDPVGAPHLNLPSVDAPTMPGRLETVRTAKNVTGKSRSYQVSVVGEAASAITVTPSSFTADPGQAVRLTITIRYLGPERQRFAEIRLAPQNGGPTQHLPVAFVPRQGDVSLTSTCARSLQVKSETTCDVTAVNKSYVDTRVDLSHQSSDGLVITGGTGVTVNGKHSAQRRNVTLAAAQPGVPALSAGPGPGYHPLADLGVAPEPIGDEDLLQYQTPSFVYAGVRYSQIGVDSNGYLVAGPATAQDNNCCSPAIPDVARPNNVLAPFWTDLDGSDDDGIRAATVESDQGESWIVVEWDVDIYGTDSHRQFQLWIGTGTDEDISFVYDPAALPAAPPAGQPFVVGAENVTGTGGDTLPAGVAPAEDLRVTSSAPVPGGSVTLRIQVRATQTGLQRLNTWMASPLVPGLTVTSSAIRVR